MSAGTSEARISDFRVSKIRNIYGSTCRQLSLELSMPPRHDYNCEVRCLFLFRTSLVHNTVASTEPSSRPAMLANFPKGSHSRRKTTNDNFLFDAQRENFPFITASSVYDKVKLSFTVYIAAATDN